jgi:hypothetical protein
MTKKQAPILSAEDALIELDAEIQKDRKNVESARKLLKRASTVAGVAFVLMGVARVYPPAILLLVPTMIAGAAVAVAAHFHLKDKQEDLDGKYDRQAQLILAVEAARKEGPSAKQALDKRIAAEFADVSVVERLEKAVQDLRNMVDGSDNDDKTTDMGKASPAKKSLRL